MRILFLVLLSLISTSQINADTIEKKVKDLAKFKRAYYLALVSEGFSKEEAMEIIVREGNVSKPLQSKGTPVTKTQPEIQKTKTPEVKQASVKKPSKPKDGKIVITIYDEKNIYYNDEKTELNSLVSKLAENKIATDHRFYLRAGDKTKAADIDKVAEKLLNAKYNKFQFIFSQTN